MPSLKYDVFLVDPPWPKKRGGIRHIDRRYRSDPRGNVTRDMEYKTLPTEDIFQLLDQKVFSRSYETHTVFLWGIDQFLFAGEQQMLDRGYRLHARIIWDKMNGIAPAFSIRYSHEYLSWFYKPKFTPVAKESRGVYRTVLQESAREHSRKPEVMYKVIQAWYPGTKKLDVFSRERRPGWDQFGNETDLFSRRT